MPTRVPATTRGVMGRRHRGVTGAALARKALTATTISRLDESANVSTAAGSAASSVCTIRCAERLAGCALLVPEAHDEDSRPSPLLAHLT